MCEERVEKGGIPTCALHCLANVIEWGPVEELSKKLDEKRIEGRDLPPVKARSPSPLLPSTENEALPLIGSASFRIMDAIIPCALRDYRRAFRPAYNTPPGTSMLPVMAKMAKSAWAI